MAGHEGTLEGAKEDPEEQRRQQAHLKFTASHQARHAARQQTRYIKFPSPCLNLASAGSHTARPHFYLYRFGRGFYSLVRLGKGLNGLCW